MWAQDGARSSRLTADAFLFGTDVRRRIVTIVAPARVVELNDMIAVVRANRLGEAHGADALPVVDLHGRQALDTRRAAVVRHADVEHHRTGRRRIAWIEHVTVDLIAKIEVLAFDAALPLR